MRWWGGGWKETEKLRKKKRNVFLESVQLYVVLSGAGRSSKIVHLVSLYYDKCTFSPSRVVLLSFHFCLSDSLPSWNALAFWQRSFWVGLLLAPGYPPLWGPTPSTKETFAYSILQIILGALASPGIHIDPVLPQAAFVSQGMSEAPVYDFHFSKKRFGSFCSGAFEAPFTTLLLGKGLRLTATPYKFLRALSVLKWVEGHNTWETDYQ